MHNNKGFTLIELIAVMIIISVLTAVVIPKIIDLEGSAERKLLGTVISELNAREQLAFLDFKLGFEYVPINTSDLAGISLADDELSLTFDGGGKYDVYKVPYTEDEDVAGRWYEGEVGNNGRGNDDDFCPPGQRKKGLCE